MAALLLASCTEAVPEPDPTPTGAPPETAGSPAPGGGGPVQDVWVYERIRTVTEDGALRDITSEVLDGIGPELGEATELLPGVQFRAAPTLDAVIQDDAAGTREDLQVVAGVVETDDGQALQVIASPTGDTSVEADDTLGLDLSFLPDLQAGDPLVADFAFAQGLPAADGSDSDLDPVDQLARRISEDRFQWYGEEYEGELIPALLTAVGAVPGPAAPPGPGGAPGTAEASGAAEAEVVLASATVPVATGGGGGGGGIPLKARPTTDPVKDLGKCKKSALKCISDYFDNMEKGFEESLDKIFRKNMPGEPPPPDPPCTGLCGGASGDPHLETFDGYRYDFQAAGEFLLAGTGELSVQMRTEPWADSTRVSVVTAVAVGTDGHRVTVRADRAHPVHVDGEPADLAGALLDGLPVGSARAQVYGADLYLTSDSGPRVTVRNITSGRALDVFVDAGPAPGDGWAGLLGDADGDAQDDRQAAADPEQRYTTFADRWRVTEDSALFDYAPGEDTQTFTDRDLPREVVTVADLPAADVARARAVCEAAGITGRAQLDACILDYALTGDPLFVRSAVDVDHTLDLDAGTWATVVPGTENLRGDAQLDTAGHVLVPARTGDGGLLSALAEDSGELAWQAETSGSACLATTDAGLVATVGTQDGDPVLQVLAAADGSEVGTVPLPFADCDAMAATGDTVVGRGHHTVVGVDVAAPELRFERTDLAVVAGPVVSADGALWVVVDDDDLHALRLDPADGTTTARVPLHSGAFAGEPAPTPDGLVLRLRGEEHGTGTLTRVDADGLVWERNFPGTVGGVTADRLPEGQVAVSGEHVALFVASGTVGVFDLATGEPESAVASTSFSNNGGRLALVDGTVVVGPFGSDHWVEALPLTGGQDPVWTESAEGVEEVHDVKRIGPVTASGQVVVLSRSPQGVVAALVGPGG